LGNGWNTACGACADGSQLMSVNQLVSKLKKKKEKTSSGDG